MGQNIVSLQISAARVVDSKIWSQLPNELLESILKWLPLDSVSRLRTVCKKWNNLLSGEEFLTWRRENFKEDPWLLILNNRMDYYRLNVSTKALKAFPLNCVALESLGGLVLTSNGLRNKLFLYNPLTRTSTQIPRWRRSPSVHIAIVCNPKRETFVRLPLERLNKEDGIRLGDILWKGDQYQVVTVHESFIEVYDFSKQSWFIVRQLPPDGFGVPRDGDIVFFKGLFFCIVSRFSVEYVDYEWGVMVFGIKEDCTCHMVNLFWPIPNTSPLWLAPHLVVCGSALVLIRHDSLQLCLWELEYDNNLNITSSPSWKAIAKMPQEVSGFFNSNLDPRRSNNWFYKSLAAGNYICFKRGGSGNLVFFNKQNSSWSCFSMGENVENCIFALDAYVYDPRPDISIQ
ncbi:hypothetical protein SUGI_1145130 [Cryptomeria japonica]|nr:hypothetical protein SUGI_1145130 [Cryptomeria japonica]